MSPKTWRLSELGAKHAFLRAGLGWGGMPLHLVEADLANGTLVPLTLAESDAATSISMSAIYRTDTPPGPAGRWLIDRLKQSEEGAQTMDRVPFRWTAFPESPREARGRSRKRGARGAGLNPGVRRYSTT